jgi:hypothetical protein
VQTKDGEGKGKREGLHIQTTKQTNCMALVRERTITTERPPLVGEDSYNFCG